MNNIEKKLAEEYGKIFELPENRPEWAVKKGNSVELIHPATPFAGEKYSEAKVLLYASAENLTGDMGHLFDDSYAINRRRKKMNEDKTKNFPDPHIRPVSDGSLMIATAYILKILGKTLSYHNPYEFIEYLAVDNFCKYSVESGDANQDYANCIEKLRYSFEYVKADLEFLKPEILILPKVIYHHREVQQLIRKIVPACLLIPIYQINSRNINIRISKEYPPKDVSTIDPLLVEWQKKLENGITGKTNENFCSVYTYLERVVKA